MSSALSRAASLAFAITCMMTAIALPAIAQADDSDCAAVHWIGAAGSGEPAGDGSANGGMGGMVYPAYRDLQDRLAQDGRIITAESVAYPAAAVPDPIFDGSKWPPFIDSLNQGTSAVGAQFASYAQRCPNSKIVLSGYSQGAMAVHRNLYVLADHPQLAAVLLIADGDRKSNDTTITYGTVNDVSDFLGQGIGQAFPAFSHANTADLPSSIGSRTISVCDTGDPVCNYNAGASVLPILTTGVHTGYAVQFSGPHAWGQQLYDLVGPPPAPQPVSEPENQPAGGVANATPVGAYTGTFGNAVTRLPAVLNLTSADPIAGTVDIPGVCSATWSEVQRLSDYTRIVSADVTSGGARCRDNQWALTISAGQINGVDTNDGTATVSFVHR